jgi:hypothetical protein
VVLRYRADGISAYDSAYADGIALSDSALLVHQLDMRRGKRLLVVATILAIAAGMTFTNSLEEFAGYLLITLAVLMPCLLWMRMGASGIPVLPAVAVVYYIYYGVPILSGNLMAQEDYSSEEILAAALTVTLFLVVATLCCWAVLRRKSRRQSVIFSAPNHMQLKCLIVPGLILGFVYYLAVASGTIGNVGAFGNLVRCICLSALLISCYAMGYSRASGTLHGTSLLLAAGSLGAIIVLTWSTLFLVDGLLLIVATSIGYTLASKRVPWRVFAIVVGIAAVLHAGKGEMRSKYWEAGGVGMMDPSLIAIPQRMGEWLATGVEAIASGKASQEQTILERASLLQLLLHVQRLTPDYIPYLKGETYALLPLMIVPRFIQEDKLSSQASMTLLNIRYGFQTAESAQTTSIGWGLVAEAYANFGNVGVFGIAVLFGLWCGFLMRITAARQLFSFPSFIAIGCMMVALALELDFSYLVLDTGQSAISITALYVVSLGGITRKKLIQPQLAKLDRPVALTKQRPINS